MASVNELRRRIRDLERQLAEQGRAQEAARTRSEAAFRRRQEEMRTAFRRDVERLGAGYEEKFRRLQEDLLAELQRETEEIRRQDEAAQRQRNAVLSQLRDANEELRQAAARIQAEEAWRGRAGQEAAETLLEQAAGEERRVDTLPHGFFFPGELDVLREHLETARRMAESGVWEAAAAAADAAMAEMEILAIRVRESQREWEDAYALYRSRAAALREQMERFETGEIVTPGGAFYLSDQARTYWSAGQYGAVREAVRAAWGMVEEIDRAGGPAAWLMRGGGVSQARLVRQTADLLRLAERLTAAERCVSAERFFSDQRYLMGQAARDVLLDMGAAVPEAEMDFLDGQPIDSYRVTAVFNRTDTALVTFLPIREDGVAVRNLCLIALDVRSVSDPDLLESLAGEMAERLRAGVPDLERVEWYPRGPKAEARERAGKQTPDMRELVRKLERKYR